MSRQRAVIFANGQFSSCEHFNKIVNSADLIIAADGGAENCHRCGISPHVVIGDLDSISTTLLLSLHDSNTRIIHYPAEKNETDLELAIQMAINEGYDEIIILSALGGRWDMSLSNLLLMALPFRQPNSQSPNSIKIIDGNQEAFIIPPGHKTLLIGLPGDVVSLIPIFLDAIDVITDNLEYPLKSETLYFGSTRGVSNVISGENASVAYKSGLLLCLITHNPDKD